MPSQAFSSFKGAIDEVGVLGTASHPSLAPSDPQSLKIARAIGRGQIVLLSSHFERYIYALNEELIAYVNSQNVDRRKLPKPFRLVHSTIPIDELAQTGWEQRAEKLEEFVSSDAWMWTSPSSGTVVHARMLTWMKAPNPKNLVRYFRLWGVDDVFTAITRKTTSRQAFWLGVQGLVDLRNNIAHGDYLAQATQTDVKRYVEKTAEFCKRIDKKISTVVAQTLGVQPPW